MKAKERLEQIRKDWLQQPNLTDTLKEYLNNYFYDDYSYCEECDMIDHDSNWFWYDKDSELASMFADASAGIIDNVYYIMKKYGVDEKTAREMQPKQVEVKPSLFPAE